MDVDKVDEEEALRRMKKIDKERTEYHKYFTGRNWMDMENYDLPINASRIDYDQMIKLIKDYLKTSGNDRLIVMTMLFRDGRSAYGWGSNVAT